MRFANKTAIVTGAASGIGLAVAKCLASEGASVVASDLNGAGLAAASASYDPIVSIQTDVSDTASCQRLVEAALAATGRIDILCNIAGVLDMASLSDLSDERWARTIAVNLTGVFQMCRAAMPSLLGVRGCVINMASTAGIVGVPYNAAYSASKHGVVGLTKALALEFANRGVRVNCVCPGGVDTPMISGEPPANIDWDAVTRSASWLNHGELSQAEDIANAVVFLASSDARMVTGISLPVDGGQVAA